MSASPFDYLYNKVKDIWTRQETVRVQQQLRENRCATLIDFIKDENEQLHHYEDGNGDRFHLRAPAGTGYEDAAWEVIHFDNTNGKTKCLENQVYTDFAAVPEEDTAEYAIIQMGPVAFGRASGTTLVDLLDAGHTYTLVDTEADPNKQVKETSNGVQFYSGLSGADQYIDTNVPRVTGPEVTVAVWGTIGPDNNANHVLFGSGTASATHQDAFTRWTVNAIIGNNFNLQANSGNGGYAHNAPMALMVLTYKNGEPVRLRVNDAVVAASSNGGADLYANNGQSFDIGRYPLQPLSGDRWYGAVQSFIVWDRQLTNQELTDLYNLGTP